MICSSGGLFHLFLFLLIHEHFVAQKENDHGVDQAQVSGPHRSVRSITASSRTDISSYTTLEGVLCIHLFPLPAYSHSGRRGQLELIPAVKG